MPGRDIFKRSCALWGFALIYVFLLLDFLFRFDSLAKFLRPFDIAVDLSIMIAAYAAIVLAVSLLSTVLHLLLPRARIWELNLVIAMAFAIFTFCNFFVKWSDRVTGNNLDLNIVDSLIGTFLFIFLLLTVALIRNRLSAFIEREAERLNRLMLAVCVIAVTLIVLRLIQVRPHNHLADHLGSSPALKSRQNVVLITFDSLRAEDMSVYGYRHDTTPNMRAFAGQSYVFDHMYANANWTRPAVASILTGVRPSTHGLSYSASQNIYAADDRWEKNLPMYLRRQGYDTLASVGNLIFAHPRKTDNYEGFVYQPYGRAHDRLVSTHSLTNYLLRLRSTAGVWFNDAVLKNVPFVSFVNMKRFIKDKRARLDTEVGFMGEPAEATFQQAERLIQSCNRPFFLWVHIFPPHMPYLPPAKFRHKLLPEQILETRQSQNDTAADWNKLRLRYDEMIMYADAAFGDFMTFLRKSSLYDNSLIIVSADHGESFEHGYKGHGGPFLYQQLVNIPLLIHAPGQTSGFRISSNAEQVDIAPTIVDLLGGEDPGWFEGESLRGAMAGRVISERPKYPMNLEHTVIKGVRQSRTVAVVKGQYKYVHFIDSGNAELFDLVADPAEQHNLVQQDPARAEYLRSLILTDILRRPGHHATE